MYMYTHTYIILTISLSLYLYISLYIYIYMYYCNILNSIRARTSVGEPRPATDKTNLDKIT